MAPDHTSKVKCPNLGCPETFNNRMGKSRHLRSGKCCGQTQTKKTHQSLAFEDYVDGDFTCTMCGSTIKHRNNLARHMKMCVFKKRHKCPYCDQEYNTRTKLKFHLSSDHGGNKQFKCGTCGRGFKSAEKYDIHAMNCSPRIEDNNRRDKNNKNVATIVESQNIHNKCFQLALQILDENISTPNEDSETISNHECLDESIDSKFDQTSDRFTQQSFKCEKEADETTNNNEYFEHQIDIETDSKDDIIKLSDFCSSAMLPLVNSQSNPFRSDSMDEPKSHINNCHAFDIKVEPEY